MLRFICFLVIMSHLPLCAQEVNWHGYLNEAWSNILEASARDLDGNRYYAGSFNGNADLDPNPMSTLPDTSFSWRNPFIGKLNDEYEVSWVRQIRADQGKAREVIPTDDGGLLILIHADSWIDLDPGDDSLIIENPFHPEMSILCKWDKDGNPQWYWDIYLGVSIKAKLTKHPAGGYLLLGYGAGVNGIRNKNDTILLPNAYNSFVSLHFAEDGDLINSTMVGGPQSGGIASPTDIFSFPNQPVDHYFAAGSLSSSPTLIVDESPKTYTPSYPGSWWRSFIGKYSYEGKILNLLPIEGTGHARVHNIQADELGGVYVVGLFTDELILPNGSDTFKLIANSSSPFLADLFVGRLDASNTWQWVHHFSGGFDLFWGRSIFSTAIARKDDLLIVGSTLDNVIYDPNGINKQILAQTAGVTAFSFGITVDGRVGCAFPLIRLDSLYPELRVNGLDRLDTYRYYWYGIYTDRMELFDGTEIEAGSAASYMIDASFCPEYPCASIESTPCGDTLRACTWSTTSWRWFKDGVHLPESDGDSILVTQENGTYMLVAYLEDGCPYQRPDTTMIVVDHYIRFDLVVEPVNCKWGENGSLQVIPYEGAGPFEYSLDGINFDSISIFTGLDPGDYKVFVNSEAHGCLYSDSFSITTLEATHLKDTRCYGDTLSVGNYTFYEGLIDTLLFLDNVLHPGCDSTIRLEVQFKDPVQIISVQSYVCDSALTVIDTLITPYHDFVICDSLMSITQKILAPSWYIDTTIYICQGDSILINGVWYDEPTFVEAQMVSSLGCDSILLLDLQVIQPPVFEAFKDTFVASGTTLTLEAPFQNGYIYNWQPPDNLSCQNCPAPQIIAEADQSLTLYFTDAQGCFSHTVQYDIKVYAEEIAVPNMFTPNGDGVNDLFGVIVVKGPPESIKIHNFSIFNRWGKQIFNSQDVLNAWDGLHSGEPCPMDNYGWVLDVEYANGKREVLRGHVTLVR